MTAQKPRQWPSTRYASEADAYGYHSPGGRGCLSLKVAEEPTVGEEGQEEEILGGHVDGGPLRVLLAPRHEEHHGGAEERLAEERDGGEEDAVDQDLLHLRGVARGKAGARGA